MPRTAKPAPPSVDLDTLAALALDAWNRQGEAEATDATGAHWRFWPERDPASALVLERSEGTEKTEVRRVSSALLGVDDAGQRVRDTLASLVDD